MKKRNTLLFAALLLSLVGFAKAAARYKIGDVIEDFTLPHIDGGSVSLSDFEGMAVFLDFWTAY